MMTAQRTPRSPRKNYGKDRLQVPPRPTSMAAAYHRAPRITAVATDRRPTGRFVRAVFCGRSTLERVILVLSRSAGDRSPRTLSAPRAEDRPARDLTAEQWAALWLTFREVAARVRSLANRRRSVVRPHALRRHGRSRREQDAAAHPEQTVPETG